MTMRFSMDFTLSLLTLILRGFPEQVTSPWSASGKTGSRFLASSGQLALIPILGVSVRVAII